MCEKKAIHEHGIVTKLLVGFSTVFNSMCLLRKILTREPTSKISIRCVILCASKNQREVPPPPNNRAGAHGIHKNPYFYSFAWNGIGIERDMIRTRADSEGTNHNTICTTHNLS